VVARLPILAALRERGFHLAFNHTVLESAYAPWLPLADYIKLDLSVLAPDQLAVLISYAGRHSQADLIAEKVETAQQYDMASSQGVDLFQGYWFARPALVEAKLLPASQASIIQLINLVRKQASTDDIEEVLKERRGAGLQPHAADQLVGLWPEPRDHILPPGRDAHGPEEAFSAGQPCC